jgi:hypothetical protein
LEKCLGNFIRPEIPWDCPSCGAVTVGEKCIYCAFSPLNVARAEEPPYHLKLGADQDLGRREARPPAPSGEELAR